MGILMHLLYWIVVLIILLGGWIWDRMLPASNATTIILIILLYTVAFTPINLNYRK